MKHKVSISRVQEIAAKIIKDTANLGDLSPRDVVLLTASFDKLVRKLIEEAEKPE